MAKNDKHPKTTLSELMDTGDLVDRRIRHKGLKKLVPRKPVAWLKFFASTSITAVALSTLVIAPAAIASAGVTGTIDYWNSLSSDLKQDEAPLPQRTVLLDSSGVEFAQFYSENRQNVPLKSVSPMFINALVATEDSRFYDNHGFDPIGLMRSVMSNASGGSQQGASGITQQLVKNLQVLNSDTKEEQAAAQNRSLATKIQELKYSIGLENKYSKEQILEKYINTVYFGNGAYGLSAAAKTYFSTTVDKLTLSQSATLVGVVNNPTIYDPIKANAGSVQRRNEVLGRLLTTGKIDQATYDTTVKEPITVVISKEENGCGQSAYPYYCQLVRDEIMTDTAFGATEEERQSLLRRGGLTITTALERKAIDTANAQSQAAYGGENRVGNGVAILVPGTGKIAGIGENREWGSGVDDLSKTEVIYAMSQRQVGSAFKPFTLVTALEKGIPPTTQEVSNGPYFPGAGFDAPPGGFSNFGNYNYGSVDAYKATKLSLNVFYVKLMERVGVLPVADMAARLGINSIPRSGPSALKSSTLSLTLGSYEISPIQMANAYSVFASGGIECAPHTVVSAIRTDTKAVVPVTDPDCHQAIMPSIANTMNAVLQGPLQDGGSAQGKGLYGRVAAAKTGTTNDFADAWMVGYTPQYATAVWSGDPRGGSAYPLDSFTMYGQHMGGIAGDGSTAAGPIWQNVMNILHEGLPAQNFAPISAGVDSIITATAIPNVQGLDVNSAISTLLDNGYVPQIANTTTGDEKIFPKNVVMSQTPNGGTNGSYKQTVVLTLSPNSDINIKIPKK